MWRWRRSLNTAGGHWTSVVFSSDKVEIAEVERRTDEKPRLLRWEASPCAVEQGAAALKPLRRRLKGRCTALLRHGDYQMLQIDAPQVADAERRDAVRWRIKEMVAFPVDQAEVDVIPIPAGKGGGARAAQAFAVAASHAVLRPLVESFQDAKLDLAAIDVPELAQRNIAALFEEENRGLALLAFDSDDGARLTFTFGGELYATRHIDVKTKDLGQPEGDARNAVFERVLLDIQRSFDNFDRNYNAISLTRLLVAPIPGAAAFVEYLRGNLYQPVELLDLGQGLDIADVPTLAEPEAQAEALLAIGAALRDESGVPA